MDTADVYKVFHVIKAELDNVFGSGLTARILMSARNKANAPIVDMNKEDLEKVIDAICSDERVTEMWGIAGIQERKKRWRESLRTVEV